MPCFYIGPPYVRMNNCNGFLAPILLPSGVLDVFPAKQLSYIGISMSRKEPNKPSLAKKKKIYLFSHFYENN